VNIPVILAHPNPGSFNHAIADAALSALHARGHRSRFHDLYAEEFDPVLPAAEFPKDAPLDARIRQQCE